MNSFEAFSLYNALKLHFSSKSYDFVKYQGKTRVNRNAFDKRRDCYQFQKLAKMPNLQEFLISNFVSTRRIAWVGDLLDQKAFEIHTQRLKRLQSLSYGVKRDLELLDPNIHNNLRVISGSHPLLLTAALRSEVSIETVIILNYVINFFSYWDMTIEEPVIWEDYGRRAKKYAVFLDFDRDKFKKIVLDFFPMLNI